MRVEQGYIQYPLSGERRNRIPQEVPIICKWFFQQNHATAEIMRHLVIIITLLLASYPAMAENRHMTVVTLEAPPLAHAQKNIVKGALTEVVREAFSRMGYDSTLEIMPWSRALDSVRFGETDAIFYTVRNKKRESFLHFPNEPLWVERTVAIVPLGSPVSLDSELTNARNINLGTGRSYRYGPHLDALIAGGTFSSVEVVPSSRDNMEKLLAGRIDAFLTDYPNALELLNNHDSGTLLDMVRHPDGKPAFFDEVPAYLAFSRISVTLKTVQTFSQTLQDMKQDGSYQNIMSQYDIENATMDESTSQ